MNYPTGHLLSGEVMDYLRGLNLVSILLRFTLATLCSSLIGFERGKRLHAAGLRTHIVVCLGGAAAMMLNQYTILYMSPNADPNRIGAQVISGIGFLGAGTIMVTGTMQGQRTRGLTTAAGLWASACMGLIIGVGFYEGAIIMCLFLFMVIVSLNNLDVYYLKKSASQRLYLEYDREISFGILVEQIRKAGWNLSGIEPFCQEKSDRVCLFLDIDCTCLQESQQEMLPYLEKVEGVLFVSDL